MDVRSAIRFYLNGDLVTLAGFPPHRTVLDFLRLDRRLTGTKEGCAEGDCGACTVLVGRLDAGGTLRYRPINACIGLLAALDGAHLVTIEHLAGASGGLNPVQRAMVAEHGSQCGFCTPGIVMALEAHWLGDGPTDDGAVDRALQGNLCRCTGYASIVRAARAVESHGARQADPVEAGTAAMAEKLAALADHARVVIAADGARAVIPADADDLAALLLESPDAMLVAGATDVGLSLTKALATLPDLLLVGGLPGLCDATVDDGAVRLGAGMTYEAARPVLAAHFPTLGALLDRIGGPQVRHAGTIGGNIGNGSPIGDMPPTLIALGTTIVLRRGDARRTLPLDAFFLDYRRQDRRPGEFIESIAIPHLEPDARFAAYKVTKRRDEDISAVMAAFRLRLDGERIVAARIAYGGMAAIPKRARAVEAALIGRPFVRDTIEAAMARYDEDFRPLDDWRASAGYRMTVARNLLLRFWLESTGAPARLSDAHHGRVPMAEVTDG
ncbi:xanthine dehydrogenase small subunit [Prosthecomicrobium pneumaticum]|uniref:Xanthine dehydrogenase small subunit n=1 Tax=Prosthecomicrobium pneumaticum TaxID=81895 RepID=A0A7W9FMJ9_9HYPH|nr:xanthine dehydrogenase small subunit [Prosthecomicrobium pneumaticum]MBB5753462.1 xanthine dehydrogenase small subunit [Prosthecomicrobium pneumaticum]